MSEIETFTEIVMAVSAVGITIILGLPYRRFKRQALEEEAAKVAAELNVDPVCGMTVDSDNAASSFEYKDKTYYFCSADCLQKFHDDPERFINLPPQSAAQTSAKPRR